MLHRLSCVCLLITAAVLIAIGGCQSTGNTEASSASVPTGDAKEDISALLDQYTQALLKKDLAALDRIWADDLTFINLRGELLTKQNRMENIKSGATAFKSIQVSDKQIRTYGQVAVATSRVAIDGQYSGQEGSGNYGVTIVWARPKGTWQMVAVQMTRITQ